MRFKLDLKKKWKGFLKRSSEYRMSVFYGLIGLFLFFLAFYGFISMTLRYRNDESSFMVETAEELRAVGFASSLCFVCGILLIAALLCLIAMVILYQVEQNKRLKRIEEFLEEDGVFNFRKDKE